MKKFFQKIKESFIGRFFLILWISGKRYSADGHGARAVALTYYTLFAIVPTAALLFGIAKGFDLDDKLRVTLAERFANQQQRLEYICKFADTTLKQARGGVVAGVGVIALIWTVLWLATSIESAFNAVWGLPPRKNIWRRFSDYMSGILLMPLLLVLISSAGVFFRSLCNRMIANYGGKYDFALGGVLMGISNLMPLFIAVTIFFLIYLCAPNTRVRPLPALLAGALAGICYQALQDSFLFLQKSIFTYNHIYGSFAILPLFLMWMRWSWEIALFGAEVGFVAQNLDTGMFDRDAVAEPSNQLRRFWQLAVAQKIYARFAAGGGASTFDELNDHLALPMVRLERELTVLIDAGVICRTAAENEEESFVPLLPEGLTLAECIRVLDTAGNNELLPELKQEENALYDTSVKLQSAVLESPDNIPLAKLG